jgi:hypothetical protein
MRKELTQRQFTVTDIEILTDRISELGSDLRRLRKSIAGRIYEHVPDEEESS